jgi:hypothetical protein
MFYVLTLKAKPFLKLQSDFTDYFYLHPQTRVSSLQDSSVWLKKIELLHQSVHFTELA